MVNHKILLNVLKHNFGLEDTVLKWFDPYLHPRSYKVNIGKEYSSEGNLTFSVPQWSCAEAQIFNLYCITIHEVVNPPLNLHKFADNPTVKEKFKAGHWEDEGRCIHELEKCTVHLKVWMDKNWFKMNSDKTGFILFGSKPLLDKCITASLNINNMEIKVAEIIRYLGVLLDRQLNFKLHITSKC